MKKLMAIVFAVAVIASGFAVSGASASVTRPGCGSHQGVIHTGC